MTFIRDITAKVSSQGIGEVIRYCLVGGLTFLIFISVSSAPVLFPRVAPGAASALAIFTSSIFNFMAQYRYTFKSERKISSAALRYFLLIVFNSCWGGLLVQALVSFLLIDTLAANVVCAAAITVLSFPAMRYFVM